jgi:hypothetical protein
VSICSIAIISDEEGLRRVLRVLRVDVHNRVFKLMLIHSVITASTTR